jgi:hypothetical protein
MSYLPQAQPKMSNMPPPPPDNKPDTENIGVIYDKNSTEYDVVVDNRNKIIKLNDKIIDKNGDIQLAPNVILDANNSIKFEYENGESETDYFNQRYTMVKLKEELAKLLYKYKSGKYRHYITDFKLGGGKRKTIKNIKYAGKRKSNRKNNKKNKTNKRRRSYTNTK